MISTLVNVTAACSLTRRELDLVVQQAARFEKKIHGQVELTIIGDRRMRSLNQQHRGMDRPTDVLSFAWSEGQRGQTDHLLGQIYLDYAQIKRQAKRFKVPHREEGTRMVAHGLLHIVGYDHVETRAAKKMFALQEKIVAVVGRKGLF